MDLRWVKVLESDELQDDEVKMVVLGDRSFALSRVNGRYGAVDNRCPHQGAPLGYGTIDDGLLRCPLHAWRFHPETGEMPGAPSVCVEAFPVEVRDDGVYIGLT